MATSLELHQRLVTWMRQNDGYLHPNIKISHTAEKGYYVVVADGKTIPATTRIASCPMPGTLSVLNALDVTPFRCKGTRFPGPFLVNEPHIVQNFFLMEQYVLGSKSWWAPYIATLPTPSDAKDLAFIDREDLVWLEGTNLKAAMSTQIDKWRLAYSEGLDQLKRLHWPSAVEGLYTWELFHWAATMFGSRSFTSQVLADTLPADRARPIGRYDGYGEHQLLTTLFSDGFPVLLPLLDLLNYKPLARVEWQARYSFVGLQVLDAFGGGQEIFNNYGPRDNETLMLGYAFTIEDNPFDHFSVAIRVPPNSPLAHSRSWTPDPKSDESRRCYIFNAKHPRALSSSCLEFSLFSYDLIDSISVLSSNDRELQTMYKNKQTLISHGLRKDKQGVQNGFEDYRNILSVISQLLHECKVREATLVQTRPETVPESSKQQYAHTYRNSQLSILQSAILVCQFILRRAASPGTDSKILDAMPLQTSALRTLVQHHPCITRPGELFSILDLFSSMNTTLSGVKTIVERVRTRLSNAVETDLLKSQFAIVLGALQVEFTRGEKIPQRLRIWINRLTQFYPPEDESWSYVPHAGPYEPGEAPPPMLMTLLRESHAAHVELAEALPGFLESDGSPNASLQGLQTNGTSGDGLPADVGLTKGNISGTSRWLKPGVICWGWNVMEEEGVRIPHQILDETSLDYGGSSFMLYCPRV